MGAGKENGKEWNKRIRWSQQKMKEVLCFMYNQRKDIRGKLPHLLAEFPPPRILRTLIFK
jgi:hypothetical protein